MFARYDVPKPGLWIRYLDYISEEVDEIQEARDPELRKRRNEYREPDLTYENCFISRLRTHLAKDTHAHKSEDLYDR